jgi:hypothetical protein
MIDIILSCITPAVIGQTVDVQVLVQANNQTRITSCDLVFGWDTTKLEFVGIDNSNILEPLASFLPQGNWDYYGINETLPPADGNGLYYWLAPLTGIPVYITQQPSLLTTLKFKVLPNYTPTSVDILPEFTVFHTAETVIYGSDVPGMNVTGTLTNAPVNPVMGDFDYNGLVGSQDMAMLLVNWGSITLGPNPYDLDKDGQVGSGDLSLLLASWG